MGTEPQQPLWSRNFIFICLIGLLVSVGMQVLNSTMTLYADSLGASATFSGVMGTLFAIFAGIFRMISGRVSDVRGRRPTMMIGAVVFSLSLLAFGMFAVLPALLVFRSIQAVGFSAISTASATAAADVTPRKRLGRDWVFLAWDNHWRWRSVRLSDLPLPAGESLKPFILSRPDWLPFVF